MKIHLIRRETVERYVSANASSKIGLLEWLLKIKYADWVIPGNIMETFPTADLLGKGSSRVVFNIGGNKYRLIAKFHFGEMQVHLFICWIGTHSEYDFICKNLKQYTISEY